jgi:hypothetical protein
MPVIPRKDAAESACLLRAQQGKADQAGTTPGTLLLQPNTI